MAYTAAQVDAAAFGVQALALCQDAAAVLNSAYGLLGDLGRYAAPVATPGLLKEADALAAANVARAGVAAAVAQLNATTATAGNVPSAVQAVMAAVAVAVVAPVDRLRACAVLAGAAGATPLAVLCRRLGVIALVSAARAYLPTSFDDAQAVLQQVADALDAEVTAAGDAEDDASYDALRTLRAAAVADLTARGASLAPLVARTLPLPLPMLVVAQVLYGDARRADEIVRRTDPVHPLFMPTELLILGR